jgi:hypothetical protein
MIEAWERGQNDASRYSGVSMWSERQGRLQLIQVAQRACKYGLRLFQCQSLHVITTDGVLQMQGRKLRM